MRALANAARRAFEGMPWGWVLSAGFGAAALTFLLQRLIIFGYVRGPGFFNLEEPRGERLDRFAAVMGHWGIPALHVLLTLLAAFWVARRVGAAPVRDGLWVGLVAAVSNQLIVLVLFPPWLPAETAQYAILGAAAGAFGGYLALRELAGRESLYRASRAIGAARDARGVAAAIGEHLAPSGTREICLWGVARRGENDGPTGFVPLGVPLGAWRPEGVRGEAPGTGLGAIPESRIEELGHNSALTLRTGDLPDSGRAARERDGVRSILLVPLVVPDERAVGLLSVASRRGLRPSGGAARAFQTIASQAALALENSRLVTEARRLGRESGVMRERQRLAREIHDTLAQGFTSVVMHAQAAEAALPDDPEGARFHHEQIARTAREGLSEAHRMVRALRPEPLEKAPLHEALVALAGRWSDETGTVATAGVTGEPRPLDPEAEATLLRVAQEALANVRKHARAGKVALTLSYMAGRVSLDARDDGIGFDPEAPPRAPNGSSDGGGFGLAAMRERVADAGGTLTVESAPGEGTTIVAELPADGSAERQAREEAGAEKEKVE